MARRTTARIRLVTFGVAFLAAGAALFAQDPQSTAGLTSLAGKYEGVTEAPPVKARVVCDLRVQDGNIVGTLQLGHELLLVAGATLSGNVLTLNLDVNGLAVPLVGVFKDGRFEGTALGETIVMTKLDPAGKPFAFTAPWASVAGWSN